MREAVLSEQFGINDLLDPDCVPLKYPPENNVHKITDAHIDLPPSPPPVLSNVTEEGGMNNVKVSTPILLPLHKLTLENKCFYLHYSTTELDKHYIIKCNSIIIIFGVFRDTVYCRDHIENPMY